MKWTVYILRCADKSLYTGITNNISRRYSEHKSGKGSKYVRSKKAVRIVHVENFRSRSKALKREAGIKRLTHREKLMLIRG